MVELTELKSSTLADGVETSLLEYIRRSGLNPGDMLPKEEELSEQLKVSRHIVREGISRLKTLGLIESRKHKGMILTRPNVFAGVSKLAQARLFSENECREFMQIRAYMELGMTESIFRRKTPENLRELHELAGSRRKHPTMEEEIAFHSKLVSIGGNQMGAEFLKILTSAFIYIFTMKIGDRKTPYHADICNVLEKGSLAAFHEIMKQHFCPYIQENIGSESDS